MKLLLMTTPHFFVEEDQILTALFEEGLETLHLRKPLADPIYFERLFQLIPDTYHKRIVIHDHFYLKDEFGLLGIHLSKRNPEVPAHFRGQISQSCHTLEEVVAKKDASKYVFLSPIYDSISKSDYPASFSERYLQEAAQQGIIDKKVMALGGVTLEKIKELRQLGFGGVVILGDVWNRFDIHMTQDYKELICYFRQLMKAAN